MVARTSFLFYLCALLLFAGCAPINREQDTNRYFWPPPPDRPRIEWIANFSSQLDIEKTPQQQFWSNIMGDEPPIPFTKPVEVKSDPANKVFYVSDVGKGVVHVYDLGKHELRFIRGGPDMPPIHTPLSLALDHDNNLYLLERRHNNIVVFDHKQKYLRYIELSKYIKKPVAMNIDKQRKRILVADGASNTINFFDLDGTFIRSFGSPGESEGKFNLPISVCVTSKGDIVVADSFNARIQIFDTDGRFKNMFGRRGDGSGDFQLIKSVAVDSEDNIYVLDGRGHKVMIFSTSGELLLSFGNYYPVSATGRKAPGGFSLPVSIDVDSDDNIFVVDQLNQRVQRFKYISEKTLETLK